MKVFLSSNIFAHFGCRDFLLFYTLLISSFSLLGCLMTHHFLLQSKQLGNMVFCSRANGLTTCYFKSTLTWRALVEQPIVLQQTLIEALLLTYLLTRLLLESCAEGLARYGRDFDTNYFLSLLDKG